MACVAGSIEAGDLADRLDESTGQRQQAEITGERQGPRRRSGHSIAPGW